MGALINLPLSIPVVAGWGAWLAAGLVLVVWSRKLRESQLRMDAQRSAAKNLGSPARPKSGVRTPKPATAAPPVDAFGELQALLDPPPSSVARRPGD
jgi:hypothetical protein